MQEIGTSARASLVRVHRLIGARHRQVGVVPGFQFERTIGKADRNRLPVPLRGRCTQLLRQDVRLLVRLGLVGVAEQHAQVISYVKNQGLGLEIPYKDGSMARSYIPDFIVQIDDGRGADDPLHLIVEVKGYRQENVKLKSETILNFAKAEAEEEGIALKDTKVFQEFLLKLNETGAKFITEQAKTQSKANGGPK